MSATPHHLGGYWGCTLQVSVPGKGAVECDVEVSSGGEVRSYDGIACFDSEKPEGVWYPGFDGPRTFTVDGTGKYVDTGEPHYFQGSITLSGATTTDFFIEEAEPP